MTEKERITAENLKLIFTKLSSLAERLPALIDEACYEYFKNSGEYSPSLDQNTLNTDASLSEEYQMSANILSDDELGIIYREARESVTEEIKNSLPVPDSSVENFSSLFMSLSETAISIGVAQALAKRIEVKSWIPEYSKAPCKVAYFRNYFSDEAFRIFSKELYNPTVEYCDNFRETCDEVYRERCDFCILPVASSKDGNLSGIEQLVQKYELSPLFFATVSDKGKSMKFGLFAATPMVPSGVTGVTVTAFEDDSFRISSLLTAAEHFGCSAEELTLLPAEREFMKSYKIAFSLGENPDEREKKLNLLYIYLISEYPHHIISGIYKDLN